MAVRVAVAVLLLLSAGLLYQVYMETHFQIYDAALRFHVRAASDLPAEQQLKLKVRDEVLAALKPAADRAESAGGDAAGSCQDSCGNPAGKWQ